MEHFKSIVAINYFKVERLIKFKIIVQLIIFK